MNTRLRPLSELCRKDVSTVDPRARPDSIFTYIDITSVNNTLKQIECPQKVKGAEASVRARRIVRVGDVLVATTRPNLNSVALISKEFDGEICSTGFCVLRCGPELDPFYLFAFVQSKRFVDSLTDLVQGALYPAVSDKQVLSQTIPWVSMDRQRDTAERISSQLERVRAATEAATHQLEDLQQLPQKLLAQVFDSDSIRP